MWPPRGSLAIHHQLESISVNYAAVLIADRQHNAATEAEVAKCQTIQRGDEASRDETLQHDTNVSVIDSHVIATLCSTT